MKSIDDNARRCEAAGCFETTYGTRLCDQCLAGRAPASRGSVTWRELLYARAYGGEDLAATEWRLRANAQVPAGLLVADQVDEGEEGGATTAARECPVCGNDCADDDSLCWQCRNNVHSQ